MNHITELKSYVLRYCAVNNIDWTTLLKQAKWSAGAASNLRNARNLPRPDSIRSLAKVMGESPARMLVIAGYITESDLIAGPDLPPEELRLLKLWRSTKEARFRESALIMLGGREQSPGA